MRMFAALLVVVSVCLPAAAERLDLQGRFEQGGMVIGRAEPGSQVTYADRSVRVAADGTFVIGFHRDEPATVPLQVFSAEVARARGYDVDKPRNLAKSVTVE